VIIVPTYEYMCTNCGNEFERFQSIKARPIRRCPRCGKNTVKRLIGVGAGVIFKGSGFYQTDYRSESYKKAEKSEKETPDTGTKEKKAEAKDSKSESSEKAKSARSDKKKSA
jgi:putative FmdB family regulatory protein